MNSILALTYPCLRFVGDGFGYSKDLSARLVFSRRWRMLKFDDSFGVRSLIELFPVIGELKISIIISSIDESLIKGCVSSLWMFCLLASRNNGLLFHASWWSEVPSNRSAPPRGR